jgi:hypothetical protein
MQQPAKAEIRWQIAKLQAELAQRRNVGDQMAILCLALSRRKVGTYKDIAVELRKQWDAIERVNPS